MSLLGSVNLGVSYGNSPTEFARVKSFIFILLLLAL